MQKVSTDNLSNFKEGNFKKLPNQEPKDINNSFTFTIKNSSCKALNNYYKISIKNELNVLSIRAENKTDESLIYSMKYSLNDLYNLQNPNISNSDNISKIFLFLQNIIFSGTKAQIMMTNSNQNEDIMSLTIKIISDNSKLVFNLRKGDLVMNESIESEKKNIIETYDHTPEMSDITGKNSPNHETKDLSNSCENKVNTNLLGKKRNNDLILENSVENDKENCSIEIINEKGGKNKDNETINLSTDLYGNSNEKIISNIQSSEDIIIEDKKENNNDEKNINKNVNNNKEKIINDNIINNKNNSNKENESNINNLNLSTSQTTDNNNNNKKRLIFSVKADKNGPVIDLNEKSKPPTFLVIRNGVFPEWYLHQLAMEKRKKRHGEKSDEDEEEFKVYNVDNPYQENVIRINTPMKLRTKTEFIDLSEEDSPMNNTSSISLKENIYTKYNHIIENDLLKSTIVTKKDQIELLIDSIEFANKTRNIEEEEAESNTISKINLLYMGTDDGASSYMFHQKCDGKKNLLIIIQTDANNIFGGFTKKSFDSKKVNKKVDRNSFLFNLNKLKIYKGIVGRKNGMYLEPGILSQKKFGPSFLNDAIFMGKNLLNDIGHVGEKQCGYDIVSDYEINNGDKFFRAKEVEIYQIVFNDLIFLD